MGRSGDRLFDSNTSQEQLDEIMTSLVDALHFELDEVDEPLFLTTSSQRTAARAFLDADEPDKDMLNTPDMRAVLNSGIMDMLFDMFRYLSGPLAELVFGAVMMEAGATIKEKNRARLHSVLTFVSLGTKREKRGSSPKDAFANAGQAQYAAALDHYKAGTPRSFSEPSCDRCGKIKFDVGHELIRDTCERTGFALSWCKWCNKVCKVAKKEQDTLAAE